MNFKIIEEYPLYKIYEDGTVIGWKGTVLKPLKVKKDFLYLKYRLYYESKKYKCIYIHRLVALVFIPNPKNYKYVDHIDRNPLNNNVSNLRWCSHSTNMINRSIQKNKEIPYRHITIERKKDGCINYTIFITRNRKTIIRKRFSINKWSLQDVVKKRNEIYKEFGIDIDD